MERHRISQNIFFFFYHKTNLPMTTTKPKPIRFAGIDWGSRSHHACVISEDRTVLGEKEFAHSGEGIHEMLTWIQERANCDPAYIATAIEDPNGAVVDSLMDRRFQVSSINPKQLDRFRDRFSPAGAKDDRRDARVLADAICTDPGCMRELEPLSAEQIKLREFTRLDDKLKRQRTQYTHQFRAHLLEYYPEFTKLNKLLYAPWMLELWKHVSTPERAQRVRASSVERILKKYRIRRLSAEDVLKILRVQALKLAPGAQESHTGCIQILIAQLEALNEQIRRFERKIADLLEKISVLEKSALEQSEIATQGDIVEEDTLPTEKQALPIEHETSSSETPRFEAEQDASSPGSKASAPNPTPKFSNIEILRSLPGVGNTVLAILISEANDLLQRHDYQGIRCLSGVAPVTKRSGKKTQVVQRKAAQPHLVNAVYHWSRVAIQHDPVSRAKYKALRDRGHSHGRALRTVADRLLAVACAMLRDRTLFDPDRRKVVNASNVETPGDSASKSPAVPVLQ